ncbi:TPA: hypothetical protein ACGF6M_003559, partial [Vibrio cholerae]
GVIGRFTKYSTSIFHFPLKPKLQLAYNALLRCEQRNTEAPAYNLKHQTQRIAKMPRVANHS